MSQYDGFMALLHLSHFSMLQIRESKEMKAGSMYSVTPQPTNLALDQRNASMLPLVKGVVSAILEQFHQSRNCVFREPEMVKVVLHLGSSVELVSLIWLTSPRLIQTKSSPRLIFTLLFLLKLAFSLKHESLLMFFL